MKDLKKLYEKFNKWFKLAVFLCRKNSN